MPNAELPTDDRETKSNAPASLATPFSSQHVSTRPGDYDGTPRPLPVIPGYQMVRRLGGGGMGEVYEVVDDKVAVHLALKIIRPDRAGADFVARFRREVRAMMLLDHPHIARIYGHGEADGVPFFTMKLFAGGALSDRPHPERADPRPAVELILKVAEAVEYLHQQGHVHRDLKLSNILLDEAGAPHLSDFGLVKENVAVPLDSASGESVLLSEGRDLVSDTETRSESGDPRAPGAALTRMGHVMGTFAYMSPEQTRGDTERIGPQSDLWGLGVILYELLAGQPPFRAGKTAELFRSIREDGPPPPTTFAARRDPGLDAIVLKCLAKDPAERYPSAAALTAELRDWLEKDRPRRKPRRIVWLAALVAALGLTLAGVSLSLRFKPPATIPEQRLQEAQHRLAAGDDVEWVGEQGMPLWHRVLVGDDVASVQLLSKDRLFTISSLTVVLVECCPDPKCDRYHLEAQVRQNDTAGDYPRVGLYFLHQTYGADHRGHRFVRLGFNEKLSELEMRPGEKHLQGLRQGRADYEFTSFVNEMPLRVQTAGNKRILKLASPDNEDAPDTWRTLTVDVTPESVTMKCDGQVIDACDWMTLQKYADKGNAAAGKMEPRGGFGFYVSACSASFRRVIVRPLRTD